MNEELKKAIDLVNQIQNELPENFKADFQALKDQFDTFKDLDIENLQKKAEEVEGLNKELSTLKEKVNDLNSPEKPKTVMSQIFNGIESEEKKRGKKLSDIVSDGGSIKIEINNAAGSMSNTANVSDTTIPSTGAMINDPVMIKRESTKIADVIPSTTTSENTIVETYFTNEDGTPAYIAENDPKALIDFDIEDKVFSMKKVGAYVSVSEDMLDDVGYMQNRINQVLDVRSKIVMDGALYSGTGASNQIEGLKTLGTKFDATAMGNSPLKGKLKDYKNPASGNPLTADSYAEILLAAINFQEGMNFMSQVIIVNSAVLAVMQNKYSANNGLTAISTTNGTVTVFMGIPIITYNRIPVTEYALLDTAFITNFFRKTGTIEIGRINDDFIKDKMAIKWTARHVLVINPNEAGSAVTGLFSDFASLNP